MDDSLYDDKPLTVRELIRALLEDDRLDLDSYVHVWMPGTGEHLNTGEIDTLVCEAAPHRSGKGVWLHTVLNRDGRDEVPPQPKLTGADPEPPVGTVVVTSWDQRWTRQPEGYWLAEGREDGDPESWSKVAGNYGPVRIVESPDAS